MIAELDVDGKVEDPISWRKNFLPWKDKIICTPHLYFGDVDHFEQEICMPGFAYLGIASGNYYFGFLP